MAWSRAVPAVLGVTLAVSTVCVLLLVSQSQACSYLNHMSKSRLAELHATRMKRDTITCDSSYPYRSFDGSCNNLANPSYGQTGATFRRILEPVYGGDGTGSTPRQNGNSGSALPNPRDISVLIQDPATFTNNATNQMVMQWGQFLDHDITDTPTASNASVCCYDALVTSDEVHADVTTGGACFPIIIGEGDRYFDTVTSR